MNEDVLMEMQFDLLYMVQSDRLTSQSSADRHQLVS